MRVIVTNLSSFPVALASIELGLKGGGRRGFPRHYVNRGPIEPRRNSSYGYFLQRDHNPREDLFPEDVESCALRTECGFECEVPVAQPLLTELDRASLDRRGKPRPDTTRPDQAVANSDHRALFASVLGTRRKGTHEAPFCSAAEKAIICSRANA